MTTPTYKDLITLSSTANGLVSEPANDRILTMLSIMASGQNPDGSTWAGGAFAANIQFGSGAPSGAGVQGLFYFNQATGHTAGTNIYKYDGGSWVGIA